MKRAKNQDWRNKLILDNALDYAIMTADMNGHILSWSSGAQKLFGWKETEIIGQPLDILFTDEDRKTGQPAKRREMASLHHLDPVERWHKRKDNSFFWASGDLQAFFDDDGKQQGFLKIVRNRTSERQQAEALRLSEERVRLAQEAAGIGAFEIDLDRKIIEPTEQFCRLLGLETQAEMPFSQFIDCLINDKNNLARQILETIDGESAILHLEFPIQRINDQKIRWMGYWAEAAPSKQADNKFHRILGVLQDVTERREAQEKQAILSQELAHRVKNILAIVQSIANQALNNNAPAIEAKNDFSTRIAALARAQDILTHGAAKSADLQTIVEASLDIHGSNHPRFTIDGPKVNLSPQAALSIALALHELSTNAVKYGALSIMDGRVIIHWSKQNDNFTFQWREEGGPKVEKPRRNGFGSKLIERLLPASFRGTSQLDYNPTGLCYRLVAPIHNDVFP